MRLVRLIGDIPDSGFLCLAAHRCGAESTLYEKLVSTVEGIPVLCPGHANGTLHGFSV